MKRPLVQIVADNARAAYEASGITSYRALGKKAGLSPNTVKNVMEPDARAMTQRGDVSPRMDVLDKLATALGYQAWQLMQEGFQTVDPPTRVLSKRESEFYTRIRDAYKGLDKSGFDGND